MYYIKKKHKILFAFALMIAVLATIILSCGGKKNKAIYQNEETAVDHQMSDKGKEEAWANELIESVSFGNIKENMRWLVEDIGVRNWWNETQNAAAEKIRERLLLYGFEKEHCILQEFFHDGICGKNILATLPTESESHNIILVSAHFDTTKESGTAVDNSSGVASLLEIARILCQRKQDFGVEVRFLFTAGEEQGYFGAYAYTEGLSKDELSRHVFAFNMDMTGKPGKQYMPDEKYYLTVCTQPLPSEAFLSPEAQVSVGSIAVDETKKQLKNLGEDGYFSPVRAGRHDIVAFRKAGIDSLTLSWRCVSSERSGGSDYDLAVPYYIHTQMDNLYYFDMMSLYNTTHLAAGSVARLVFPYLYGT